ncbi:histone deacetylase 2, partial [Mycena latifolia]
YGHGRPMEPHRIRVTHDLVSAYGMLPKIHVLHAKRATPESMTAFHTDEYINFLALVTPETQEELTHGGMLCAYTCLSFFCCHPDQKRASPAAQRISSGATVIAINWAGGRHHGKKGEASGF